MFPPGFSVVRAEMTRSEVSVHRRISPYNQGMDSSHGCHCMLCKALSHSLSHLIL